MDQLGQRLFTQVMELWLSPEIEKRRKENRIVQNFRLKTAQIVFSQDRNLNKIRLNDEVKAIMKVKVNRGLQKGESVYEKDIDDIENIELTSNDPNCGHITLLLFRNKWFISFDFRYNKKRVNERLEAANEFLESAEENFNNDRLRPFFENAFSCAELLTEATLIQFFDRFTLKDHKSRLGKIKKWAELGNIKEDFSNKLKRLYSLRSSARYLSSTEFKQEDPKEYLESLKEMYNFVKESIF